MADEKLYLNFIAELDRSLIVDDKTREYWLKNYRTLPVSAVEFFYDELVKQNSHVNEMVAAGVDANPELGEEIVQKGNAAKRKANTFFEAQSQKEENADQFLKQNLS